MRCTILDDNDVQRALIESYIEETDGLELVGSFADAQTFLKELKQLSFDIVFLDIKLPDAHGLDLINLLPESAYVILITAHSDFAIEAFEKEVSDYLVKPVPYHRFLKSIEKINKLRNDAGVQVKHGPLFVKTGTDFVQIPLDEIQWIEAAGDYVKIIMDKKVELVLTTMSDIQQKLPPDLFTRVHRSYIVSIKNISRVSGDVLTVSNTVIPISRTYKPKLLEILQLN